jgi:hypothetical protein
VLVDAVFHESDDQGQTSSGYGAGKDLRDCVFNGRRLGDGAIPHDHGRGKGLKEEAAEGATERPDNGMAELPEVMFLCCSRRRVPSQNAGDDLDEEIANGPGHFVSLIRATDSFGDGFARESFVGGGRHG